MSKDTLAIDTQGRVVIPKKFRQTHNLSDLTKIQFVVQGDSIILTPIGEIYFDPTRIMDDVLRLNKSVTELVNKERIHLNLIVELQNKILNISKK